MTSEDETAAVRVDYVAEAERLMALAESCDWTTPHEPYRDVAIAAAQVYATLAVATAPDQAGGV